MNESLIHSVWLAIALLLVIEGLFPFINPAAFRRFMLQISTLPDAQLRISGLLSMIIGVFILYWVN